MKTVRVLLGWALGGLLLSACSPALDWREVSPDGAGLTLLFPCKPDVETRNGGAQGALQAPRMGLARCEAAGLSYSLSWAEVADPAQLAPALAAMRSSLAGKLQAEVKERQPLQLSGMTPNAEASVQRLQGRNSTAKLALFNRGTMVYQLLVMGPRVEEAQWASFVTAIKLAP
ncbi:hypothetical protein RQP53_10995 [Paucibacter sp. APW11]|uniref:DUF1795 domain-containing protein n=1 Tax=Roseateles aquae TaxID=3077235 RepID=A0ABU3PBZ4_9BURK|nr:hypothetical protein [Paucibacter sp. APW11]MDT8999795.1 hypothetical protein [Paucibacter sp. APW11]